MRKQLAMLFIGATVAIGCGVDTKKETPRSYLITTDSATSVSRLAMTTAAMVGRHSVVPKGADTNPDHVRKCPISGEENKIVITPACAPGFDGTVECVFTEVYTCPEVSGTIVNTVAMSPDSLDFGLTMDGYQEGNADLGFIKYTGSVSASTKPDGSTTYSSTIAVVARGLGATEDTIADSASEVSVTTSETAIEFNGSSNLNTPLGKATMAFNKVDFGDCAISPKSGSIDLALVGLERAQLRVDGCGDVKLVHFVGDIAGDEEKMSEDQLKSAFGSSISDVTTMKGVAANVEMSAPAIYPEQFCVPFGAGVTLMGTAITGPAAFETPAVTNPMMECLVFNAPVEPTGVTFAHVVLEDKTGLGAFGDPTQIDVHFYRAGIVSENVTLLGGANLMIYAQGFLGAALPQGYVTFDLTAEGDLAGTDLTAFCNPAVTDAGSVYYCWSRYSFNAVFDHFGLGLAGVAPYDLGTFWFAHTFE